MLPAPINFTIPTIVISIILVDPVVSICPHIEALRQPFTERQLAIDLNFMATNPGYILFAEVNRSLEKTARRKFD